MKMQFHGMALEGTPSELILFAITRNRRKGTKEDESMDMWDKEAKIRAKSQRDKILVMLRESGIDGVTNMQLKDVAFRFGQAIHTLYMQGYVIATKDLGNGVCRYTLVNEPDVELPITNEKAKYILAQEIENKFHNGISGADLVQLIDTLGFDVKRKKGYYAPKIS